MTEITRVPLQPIAKGALGKMWLGVAAAVALGGGLAWATTRGYDTLEGGVQIITVKAGEGDSPKTSDVALINYKGMLKDGTVFDEGKQAPLPLQGVIPGFTTALSAMQKGGKYKIEIPAEQGYGENSTGPIPPNSDLIFEVELLGFMDFQQFQMQQAMMQMRQQQMQQQRGGKGGSQGAPLPEGAPGAEPR
ncbi:FKBP-type peptidyl-prolyl cis-trans isomerase [Novosphingobium sp. TH158]|uniref:FKBP-type peptidyl-prolyl cis-trans isomerase n=1 Tax=Novosphingobium sp. TH158 TaxID=2067455 RepID=UPI000C7E5C30|nr:FKBP-type peptidyl-prolyl cis-trans isomerase [Novosphingobium sp. TH158]PLK26483.1 peptidylprolyl isomerase [Novosphingobium sp. TH158]